MKKRVLSFLLVFCLCLGCLPFSPVKAAAAGTPEDPVPVNSFEEFRQNFISVFPGQGGSRSVKLMADISGDPDYNTYAYICQDAVIDLNGHSLTLSTNSLTMVLSRSAVVTIRDSAGGGCIRGENNNEHALFFGCDYTAPSGTEAAHGRLVLDGIRAELDGPLTSALVALHSSRHGRVSLWVKDCSFQVPHGIFHTVNFSGEENTPEDISVSLFSLSSHSERLGRLREGTLLSQVVDSRSKLLRNGTELTDLSGKLNDLTDSRSPLYEILPKGSKVPEPKPTGLSFQASDYGTGSLSGLDSSLAYRIGESGRWITPFESTAELTNLEPCTLFVKRSGNGVSTLDSPVESIVLTRPAAPAGVSGGGEPGEGQGKLTGLTDAMEYLDRSQGWKPVPGGATEVSGLNGESSYHVRYRAQGTALASQSVSVSAGPIKLSTAEAILSGFEVGKKISELSLTAGEPDRYTTQIKVEKGDVLLGADDVLEEDTNYFVTVEFQYKSGCRFSENCRFLVHFDGKTWVQDGYNIVSNYVRTPKLSVDPIPLTEAEVRLENYKVGEQAEDVRVISKEPGKYTAVLTIKDSLGNVYPGSTVLENKEYSLYVKFKGVEPYFIKPGIEKTLRVYMDGTLLSEKHPNDAEVVFRQFPVVDAPPVTTADYTVKHLLEELGKPGSYAETPDTESKIGTIGQNTQAQARNYEGFTAQPISQKSIAADGSTVVEIRYDRQSYSLSYALRGGSASGSYTHGSVPYGTELVLPVPSREGYVFLGWEEPLEDTMPAHALQYTAKWIPQKPFVVIHTANDKGITVTLDGSSPGGILVIAGYRGDQMVAVGILEVAPGDTFCQVPGRNFMEADCYRAFLLSGAGIPLCEKVEK